jgi:hypothetical protein
VRVCVCVRVRVNIYIMYIFLPEDGCTTKTCGG